MKCNKTMKKILVKYKGIEFEARQCPKCKEKYELSKDMARDLGVPLDSLSQFYRPKGCRQCFNTGYLGRMGVAEVLFLSPNIKNLILSRTQEHQITQEGCKEGMKTLRDNALNLAQGGFTSLEEVLRVTAA